jgi:hypothetical protein
MRHTFPLISLFFLGFCAPLSFSQDIGKIDRTIAKEPAYSTKSPWYCLLLLGPEAKAKVWMVLDGDKLYVDRNGNGDLTDPGECFTRAPGDDVFRVPDLNLGVAKKKYADVRVNWRPDGVGGNGKFHLHVIVRVNEHDQYAMVPAKAADPAKATLLHFDGPLKPFLQVEPFKPQQHFTRGKEHLLGVQLATSYPGVEWVSVSHEKGIPADVHPVVEIVFPGKTGDAKPATVKVQLTHRC